MGAGAVQPVAYAIVGDIYTPTERAKVQGFLSSVFGISAVIGPTLGAFLVEHASWSVVFWINLPIGVARHGDAGRLPARAAAPQAAADRLPRLAAADGRRAAR